MNSIEILGILSAGLILFVFIALEYGEINTESVWFDLANLLGGVGLFIYAYVQGVVPFMLTNGVWALVSGIDVVKYLLKRKGLKKRSK